MKLNLIDKAFLLKKTSLFSSLDLDLLLTIADQLEVLTCRKGDKVFQLDQEAHRMYLVVDGEVSIQGKEGKTITLLAEGEFFGDEALFHEQPRAYSVICETPLTLLSLCRSHLLSIIAECPTVAIALLRAYTQRIAFRKR